VLFRRERPAHDCVAVNPGDALDLANAEPSANALIAAICLSVLRMFAIRMRLRTGNNVLH
jgi:hypothetical protein